MKNWGFTRSGRSGGEESGKRGEEAEGRGKIYSSKNFIKALAGSPSSSSPKKGAQPPNFRPISIVTKRLDGSRCTWYGGRHRPKPSHIVLHGDLAHPPPRKKWAQPPTIFGPCPLWPNGWMDHDATWYEGRPHAR